MGIENGMKPWLSGTVLEFNSAGQSEANLSILQR